MPNSHNLDHIICGLFFKDFLARTPSEFVFSLKESKAIVNEDKTEICSVDREEVLSSPKGFYPSRICSRTSLTVFAKTLLTHRHSRL
ncbi:hypothetical protein NBRC116602_30100 [Hyphomicrobiales bacterium 4NK60-0047b]